MEKPFAYVLGDGAARLRLGLVVLQSDETLECDLRRMLPDDVGLYASRVPNAPTVTKETLAQMEYDLPTAAALLPPTIAFDVVGYGCTSGTAVIGAPRIAELIHSGCKTAATTEPVSALIAACEKLNIRRLAMLSPYIEEVSATLRQALADAGIETPHFGSFNEAVEGNVARIECKSTYAAATELHKRGDVDALFLSCTNLQTLDIIAPLEETCGCPVLSSNLVLGWHMLAQSGAAAKPPALGRLLG